MVFHHISTTIYSIYQGYEAYQNSKDAEITSPNRVTQKDGISMVSLPLATQQNSGITTEKVIASTGLSKYKIVLENSGKTLSLENNFIAFTVHCIVIGLLCYRLQCSDDVTVPDWDGPALDHQLNLSLLSLVLQ